MRVTYNRINNQIYVSVYLLPDEEANPDTLMELKKKYAHVSLFRGGIKPFKDTLINALVSTE